MPAATTHLEQEPTAAPTTHVVVRGLRALRVLTRLRHDPIAGFEEIERRFGDCVTFHVGGLRICVVAHPALIEQVVKPPADAMPDKGRAIRVAGHLLGNGLLNSEGEFHLKQRRMAQPAFQPRRLAPYAGPMVRHTEELLATFTDGAVVEMEPAMSALTLRIAGETMFGVDLAGDEESVAASLTTALDAFRIGLHPLAPLLERSPIPLMPSLVRVRRARTALLAIIDRIVRERHAEAVDAVEARGDLLTLLLRARDDDGRPMSDSQLADEALTLLLAGHETTANALAWCWQLLAEDAEVRAALDAELARVLGERAPSLGDVEQLEYTRAIFCESLRLFPPGPAISRRATSALQIEIPDGEGFTISAGTEILMPQWSVHRDERWWPEPNAFRPERFLDGSTRDVRPRYAWFPFGGGRRVCIGQGFALLEGVLVLATMAQHIDVEVPPGASRPVPIANFTVRPANGAPLVVRRR